MNNTVISIVLLSTIGLCLSCQKEPAVADFIHLGVEMRITTHDEIDLLDPQYPEAITAGDITVYHIVNGEKIKQYYPNSEIAPGHFRIHQPTPANGLPFYVLQVFISDHVENSGLSKTIIEYLGRTPDTIEARIHHGIASIFYTDLWLNGHKVNLPEEHVVVIKE